MITQNKRLIGIMVTVACLLMVPLIGMQFSGEVAWDLTDFIIAGILLGSTGLTIELIMRKVKKRSTVIMLCGLVLFALFLVWAELAVGVFGTSFAGS